MLSPLLSRGECKKIRSSRWPVATWDSCLKKDQFHSDDAQTFHCMLAFLQIPLLLSSDRETLPGIAWEVEVGNPQWICLGVSVPWASVWAHSEAFGTSWLFYCTSSSLGSQDPHTLQQPSLWGLSGVHSAHAGAREGHCLLLRIPKEVDQLLASHLPIHLQAQTPGQAQLSRKEC